MCVWSLTVWTASQHQEVTSDSAGFTCTSAPSQQQQQHISLHANSIPLQWDMRHNPQSQPAPQYLQWYNFYIVTSHSLSEFCLSDRGRHAERACCVPPPLPVNSDVTRCPLLHPHKAGTRRQTHKTQPNGFKSWQVLVVFSQTEEWSQRKNESKE